MSVVNKFHRLHNKDIFSCTTYIVYEIISYELVSSVSELEEKVEIGVFTNHLNPDLTHNKCIIEPEFCSGRGKLPSERKKPTVHMYFLSSK